MGRSRGRGPLRVTARAEPGNRCLPSDAGGVASLKSDDVVCAASSGRDTRATPLVWVPESTVAVPESSVMPPSSAERAPPRTPIRTLMEAAWDGSNRRHPSPTPIRLRHHPKPSSTSHPTTTTPSLLRHSPASRPSNPDTPRSSRCLQARLRRDGIPRRLPTRSGSRGRTDHPRAR
jgi:hypothetical protein